MTTQQQPDFGSGSCFSSVSDGLVVGRVAASAAVGDTGDMTEVRGITGVEVMVGVIL
jgi:hypothetical protein